MSWIANSIPELKQIQGLIANELGPLYAGNCAAFPITKWMGMGVEKGHIAVSN